MNGSDGIRDRVDTRRTKLHLAFWIRWRLNDQNINRLGILSYNLDFVLGCSLYSRLHGRIGRRIRLRLDHEKRRSSE